MDPALYKTIKSSRGLEYSAYHVEPTDASKPTVLLVHGFPSSSYDWRHQVAYFQLRGFGILAPDMLGYGGTAKPLDTTLYAPTAIAQDVAEVVNATAGSGPVVAIGHDWGSKVVSRLANLHADRFLGFAFLAVSYVAPNPDISYAQLLGYTAKLAGYELFGYWAFFSEDDADQVIKQHAIVWIEGFCTPVRKSTCAHDWDVASPHSGGGEAASNFVLDLDTFLTEPQYDAFYSSIANGDAEHIKAHIVGTGALRAWLLDGQPKSVAGPDYLTKEEFDIQKERFLNTGITASLNWYKITTSSIDLEDSKTIPKDNYNISKPVFFGACNKEVIALPALAKGSIQKYCSNSTIKDYDAGHWVIWEAKETLNSDLEGWMSTL